MPGVSVMRARNYSPARRLRRMRRLGMVSRQPLPDRVTSELPVSHPQLVNTRRLLIYPRSMSRYSFNSSGNLLPAQRILGPCRLFPCAFSPLFSKRLVGKPRFDSAVASCGYYRQRATGRHRPAAREHSHLVRLRQRALHLLSACISGSQALMKGGRNDHI